MRTKLQTKPLPQKIEILDVVIFTGENHEEVLELIGQCPNVIHPDNMIIIKPQPQLGWILQEGEGVHVMVNGDAGVITANEMKDDWIQVSDATQQSSDMEQNRLARIRSLINRYPDGNHPILQEILDICNE